MDKLNALLFVLKEFSIKPRSITNIRTNYFIRRYCMVVVDIVNQLVHTTLIKNVLKPQTCPGPRTTKAEYQKVVLTLVPR